MSQGVGEYVPLYVRAALILGPGATARADQFRRPGLVVHAAESGGEAAGPYDCVVLIDHTLLPAAAALLAEHGELFFPAGAPDAAAIDAAGFRPAPHDPRRAVRHSYDPRAHARALRKEGRPDLAYLVLRPLHIDSIPEPDTAAAIAAETQVCLLEHDRKASPRDRLVHFFASQALFYQAVARAPRFPVPYQCQAEFWRRIGDRSMARRLLRSVQAVAPSPAMASQISALAEGDDPCALQPLEASQGASHPGLRVLFITHPQPDYGLDSLLDGLRALLGPQNVVEYPWKPFLHGQALQELANYPCSFNHPGEPLDFDAILARLRDNAFDLLLFGDVNGTLGPDSARCLFDAASNLPWAIVDQSDDPSDFRPAVLQRIGRETCPAYFKREMLACHDYGPDTWPLPFGYPESRIPDALPSQRSRDLFWAGHRAFGLRRLYLERLESRLGRNLNGAFAQQEYAAALADSRVGLSLFGLGFDTVRYWELPAHGCLLLAERPPIRIPHDFADGQSAVFFHDLNELEDRLQHYLRCPEEAAQIAREGHRLLRQYHTATARAGQLLTRLALT